MGMTRADHLYIAIVEELKSQQAIEALKALYELAEAECIRRSNENKMD